jgi:hypothetical protein
MTSVGIKTTSVIETVMPPGPGGTVAVLLSGFETVPSTTPLAVLNVPLGEFTKGPLVVETLQVMATETLPPNGALAVTGNAVMELITANAGDMLSMPPSRSRLRMDLLIIEFMEIMPSPRYSS